MLNQNSSMKKMIIIIFIILLSFRLYAPEYTIKKSTIEYLKEATISILTDMALSYLKTQHFTHQNLENYLWLKKVGYRDIIIKQAKLETAYYTSNVFKTANNLFGMHLPYKRKTTAIGYIIADNGAKVAKYSHWTQSVDDYILWKEYNKKHITGCYYAFLNKVGYAETNNYTKILKQI